MSSLGGSQYWCYQCNQTVRPQGADIICPLCNGGFVEEVETPAGDGGGTRAPEPSLLQSDVFGADADPGGNTRGGAAEGVGTPTGFRRYQGPGHRGRAFPVGHPAIEHVLEAMSAVLQQIQTPNQGGAFTGANEGDLEVGGDAGRIRTVNVAPVNPMLVLQGQMANFLAGGGNMEVFFDNGTGVTRRLPGNFGDYFLGPGLDQLIQQLAENDPNRYGAPPASKSAVDAMPTIQISEEHLGTDAAQCAVCKDEFQIGSQVRMMPCKHMYHSECILPWLEQHNSCPVCRFEMPTDDQDYNQNRTNQQQTPPATNTPRQTTNQTVGDTGNGGGEFTIWGAPMAGFAVGRFPMEGGGEAAGSSAATTAAAAGPTTAQAGTVSSGTTAATGGGSGRRISFHFPWLFRSSSNPSPPAGGQAETSSQGGGNRGAAPGRPSSGGGAGQSSGVNRTEDDGDVLMSEARQEDLD